MYSWCILGVLFGVFLSVRMFHKDSMHKINVRRCLPIGNMLNTNCLACYMDDM